MTTAAHIPHALVTEQHAWFWKRYFQLFVLPHELVFVAAAATVADVKRGDELESQPLEQLRDDHNTNFALRVDDIESATFIPASPSHPGGSLLLRSVAGRERKVSFCTAYDAQTARVALAKTLGSKVALDAEPTTNAFEFSGKTVLGYETSHGNQIEFLDVDGRCFLWYPGNRMILPGLWKTHGKNIAFRYGRETYNPVTGGQRGGQWDTRPLEVWASTIIDVHPGDPCRLASLVLPYVLFDHAGLKTVQDARRGKGKW
jgi:hypothetical protein